MKRILIVNNNMRVGGVQRSLVNLLNALDGRYEVTLLLFCPRGELMSQIPKQVQIRTVSSGYRYLAMTREDVAGDWRQKAKRSFWAALTRLAGRKYAIALMALGQKPIAGYDAAISFLHDAGDRLFYGGCNDFVLRHVRAARKIAFLHCDYEKSGAATESNRKAYSKFDRIAACSEGCRRSFLRQLPELAGKTLVVPNAQDYDWIRAQAEAEPVALPEGRINILTVARLGKEKAVTRAVEALGQVKMENFHYYIVGDGIERPRVEALIQAYRLEEKVTLLGERTNPYGYIKAADLLLIPSLSEAAPMVIGEAACLGTPILSTETVSAREMIQETGFGWVCENSVEGLAQSLSGLLAGPEKLLQKKEELGRKAFHNQTALASFDKLLDGHGEC